MFSHMIGVGVLTNGKCRVSRFKKVVIRENCRLIVNLAINFSDLWSLRIGRHVLLCYWMFHLDVWDIIYKATNLRDHNIYTNDWIKL